MMIKWEVTLDNNSTESGLTDDGSWIRFKNHLNQQRINNLKIISPTGSAYVDSNKDGYYLSNKIITHISGSSVHLVGLGYLNADDNTVQIEWYDVNTMNLIMTESRPVENCGISLIKNTK